MPTTMPTMMASPAMRFPLELKLAVIEELILEKSSELQSALSTIALVWPDTLYFIRRHRFENITLSPREGNIDPFERILTLIQDPDIYSDITQMIRSLSIFGVRNPRDDYLKFLNRLSRAEFVESDPYPHPRFSEFVASAKRLQSVRLCQLIIPSTSLPIRKLFHSLRHITNLYLGGVEVQNLCVLVECMAFLDGLRELTMTDTYFSRWEQKVLTKDRYGLGGISCPSNLFCVKHIDSWYHANIDSDDDDDMSGDEYNESELTSACGHRVSRFCPTFPHLDKLTLIGSVFGSDQALVEYFALKGRVMFPSLRQCIVDMVGTDDAQGCSYDHVQNLFASLPDTVKSVSLEVLFDSFFLLKEPSPLFPLNLESLELYLQFNNFVESVDVLSRIPISVFAQSLEIHASRSSIPLHLVIIHLDLDTHEEMNRWSHVEENMTSLHRFDRVLACHTLGVTRCVLYISCWRSWLNSEATHRWLLKEGLPKVYNKFFKGGEGFVGEFILE